MSRGVAALSETTSLCPECLEPVPGAYLDRDGSVVLRRDCPDHGTHDRTVWQSVEHWRWAKEFEPDADFDAGTDLTVDNDHACVAVVEVTQECNLSCSYCFASSGPGGTELPFEEVVGLLETVLESGGPRPIQLSGGEPTVRDDLPEIVERARALGFEHIQINSNGIVLANRDGYAARLADAGVTAVYLQFDGLTTETYERIRGVDLLETKHAAIENCRDAGLSVVLVPTVVPGTNDHEMGGIVEFALANTDVIQSVNFQPVAHFGRYAEHNGRFSLDEAARRLASQLDTIEPRDLKPIPCCSAYCQSATALVDTGTGPVPLTRFLDDAQFKTLAGFIDESDWMELVANTPTGRDSVTATAGCCGIDGDDGGVLGLVGAGCCGGATPFGTALPTGEAPDVDVGAFLEDVLPVSFTGFMDADAADVGRLDNCCVAVPTPDGELVSFCAYNMTTTDGSYRLRTRHGWGGRPAVGEPMPEVDG